VGKISPPPTFKSQTIQPIVGLCTDYINLTPLNVVRKIYPFFHISPAKLSLYTKLKSKFMNFIVNLSLEAVELVELCPVRDGFFIVPPLEDVSSLRRPGRIRTANGLKSVVKLGMKSLKCN